MFLTSISGNAFMTAYYQKRLYQLPYFSGVLDVHKLDLETISIEAYNAKQGLLVFGVYRGKAGLFTVLLGSRRVRPVALAGNIVGATLSNTYVVWQNSTGRMLYKDFDTGRIRTIPLRDGIPIRSALSLTILGQNIYWLSSTLNNGHLVTAVLRFNILTRHETTLYSYSTADSRGLIYSMAVERLHALISVSHATSPANTNATGELDELELANGHLTRLVFLRHAATAIAAQGTVVALIYNRSSLPNSAANPKPFPLTIYSRGRQSVIQMDTVVSSPTVSSAFVVADAFGPGDLLFALGTGRLFRLHSRSAAVYGSLLIWSSSRDLYWGTLQ